MILVAPANATFHLEPAVVVTSTSQYKHWLQSSGRASHEIKGAYFLLSVILFFFFPLPSFLLHPLLLLPLFSSKIDGRLK